MVVGLVKLHMLGERDRTHIGDSERRDSEDIIFVEIYERAKKRKHERYIYALIEREI